MSTERKEIYSAWAKAFKQFEGAKKDASNPHFNKKYADLESVVLAVRPALEANGLFFRQATSENAAGVVVETVVCHESGQEINCGTLFVPASRIDPQGFGSALTYARRYSLMSAFGIAPEDDDATAATAAYRQQPPRQAPPPQPTKPTAPPPEPSARPNVDDKAAHLGISPAAFLWIQSLPEEIKTKIRAAKMTPSQVAKAFRHGQPDQMTLQDMHEYFGDIPTNG